MKSNLALLDGNSQEVEIMPEESLLQYLGMHVFEVLALVAFYALSGAQFLARSPKLK